MGMQSLNASARRSSRRTDGAGRHGGPHVRLCRGLRLGAGWSEFAAYGTYQPWCVLTLRRAATLDSGACGQLEPASSAGTSARIAQWPLRKRCELFACLIEVQGCSRICLADATGYPYSSRN